MKIRLFPISLLLLLLATAVLPPVALAQTNQGGVQPLNAFQGTVGAGSTRADLPDTIRRFVNYFLVLASIVAGVMIVYAGVQYITAGLDGNSGQSDNAKQTIIYAVIGLIVIGISAVIVNFAVTALSAV